MHEKQPGFWIVHQTAEYLYSALTEISPESRNLALNQSRIQTCLFEMSAGARESKDASNKGLDLTHESAHYILMLYVTWRYTLCTFSPWAWIKSKQMNFLIAFPKPRFLHLELRITNLLFARQLTLFQLREGGFVFWPGKFMNLEKQYHESEDLRCVLHTMN